MKILYLITKSEFGGAQTYVWQLTSHFKNIGNEAAIMAYPGGFLEQKIQEVGIKFYPNKFFQNMPHPVKDFLAFWKIIKAVKEFKPDIVHVNSAKAAVLGRLAAFLCKQPVVYTVHGWAFTEGAPLWRRVLGIVAEKIIGILPQKIICVSRYEYNLALRYHIANPSKIAVIHNGIEILDAEQRGYQAEDRREAQISGRITQKFQRDSAWYQRNSAFQKDWSFPLKIVFVGRLAWPKDPLLLLEAFSELSENIKQKAEILIIGDGPQKNSLEDFVQKNHLQKKVRLLGGLERSSVFEILKKSHIFVLTTNHEAFPYTTLEAMNFGLAIILSNVGGAPEAIDENCGILVERGDKDGLKSALEKLISDIPLAKKMGENARERVKKEFSLEKMLEATDKIYNEII